MTAYKVVVDGSNIATEGRTLPSLNQLDEAVQSFMEEHPGADVLVIVDTSFAHRIGASEQPTFEAAYLEGEIIMPPAGTIGRGDSFILKVADKLGATVFSNDSFQEFHGTYDWLFDRGRLIGGKPVPGLGWVFMDRTPVRGPKSREAVREAKRTIVRIGSPDAMKPMPVPKAPPPFLAARAEAAAVGVESDGEGRKGRKGDRKRRKGSKGPSSRMDSDLDGDSGTTDVLASDQRGGRKKKRRRSGGQSGGPERPLEPVNEPLAFISFVSEHQLGSEIDGEVDTYSSHGMYVSAGGARCYVPFSGLADPMPRSAKEVVRKGEIRRWVVKSFDAPRRGIELALIGTPGAAMLDLAAPLVLDLDLDHIRTAEVSTPRRGRGRPRVVAAPAPTVAVAKAPAKKVAAKKSVVVEKAAAKKAAAKKASTKKAPPKKAPAKKAVVVTKVVAKKVAAKKVSVKKSAPARKVAPAKKMAPPVKKASPVKKVATEKAVSAKKAVSKKAVTKQPPVVKKVVTKKATAKKATAKRSK